MWRTEPRRSGPAISLRRLHINRLAAYRSQLTTIRRPGHAGSSVSTSKNLHSSPFTHHRVGEELGVRFRSLSPSREGRARSFSLSACGEGRGGVRAGFTLIEMLIVIAILAILFGLLFIPVTAAFKFVAQERIEIQAQNLVREAMRVITGQVSEAMEVKLFPQSVTLPNPPLGAWPTPTNPHWGVVPPNPTRIDLVMPVVAVLNQGSGGAPSTGTYSAEEPGVVRETFFVGLANPGEVYNNPIARKVAGGLAQAFSLPENEYVIWRAIYNLDDPNDPVRKYIQQQYQGNGAFAAAEATALSDPWLFDDSLEPVYAAAANGANPLVAPAQIANSTANQSLLNAMAQYTARYMDAAGNTHDVGRELTPVVTLGTLDAVRSTWMQPNTPPYNTPQGGWLIDPRVAFTPAVSQVEQLNGSQYGTQFQGTRGLWVQNGSDPLAAYASGNLYWGYGFGLQYHVPGTTTNDPGFGLGATIDARKIPIEELNLPIDLVTALENSGALVQSKTGQIMVNGLAQMPPYFIDPRTGRLTLTQFRVEENTVIQSGETVYHFGLPSPLNTTTLASVDNLGVGGLPQNIHLRPQILPYSEAVQIVPSVNGQAQPPVPYTRKAGDLVTVSQNVDPAGTTAFNVAQNTYDLGAQSYAINYTTNQEVQFTQAIATTLNNPSVAAAQPGLAYQNPNQPAGSGTMYSLQPNPAPGDVDESPCIQIPDSKNDPVAQPGNLLLVDYTFTFATLDAEGAPLPHAAANYSSQRFVHITVGLRGYDTSSSTAHDFSLSSSAGSANPADERPPGT